jgi:hypothetical protein
MFLVLWKCTYSCTQSISAGRCGNHGSPSEPRSEIHMVHSRRFTSRERSHSFPHRETAATLLPFLSSPCAWSGVCHVSQMRGSHHRFQCGCLVLILNLTLPTAKRHPSDTSDARRRAIVHRFSRFLHSTSHAVIHRCGRPVSYSLP